MGIAIFDILRIDGLNLWKVGGTDILNEYLKIAGNGQFTAALMASQQPQVIPIILKVINQQHQAITSF